MTAEQGQPRWGRTGRTLATANEGGRMIVKSTVANGAVKYSIPGKV